MVVNRFAAGNVVSLALKSDPVVDSTDVLCQFMFDFSEPAVDLGLSGRRAGEFGKEADVDGFDVRRQAEPRRLFAFDFHNLPLVFFLDRNHADGVHRCAGELTLWW